MRKYLILSTPSDTGWKPVPLCLSLLLLFFVTALSDASKVTIDPTGVLVIDGQKIFPIGLTMPPAPDAKGPNGKPAYAKLHADGVSFIRTGPVGHDWDERAIEQEQAYEDAAARYGLRCMPFLKNLASVGPEQAKREALLRKILLRFKDHPGLGVWKGADEPDWGKLPVEPLVRAYQIIHEIDPDHPVWIVQAPRGTVESMRRYDAAYDITGADIYPISYPPGIHSLKPNKEISMVGDYSRTMREVAGRKPVWMTLQIAWSGVVKPGKTLRMPTLPQERFMAYEAIINGARGLVFFGGNLPQAWTPDDAKLGWNWSFWTRVLRPVLDEIGPNGPLAAALIAPDSNLPIHTDEKGVEFCVREVEGNLFLLACKREGETVRVKFTGLPAELVDGEVLFESPRHVQVKDGVLTDWFAPFDVRVYRFRRK